MADIEKLSSVPTKINLKAEFPRPIRAIFRKSIAVLLTFFGVILCATIIDYSARHTMPEGGMTLSVLQYLCMVLVSVAAVITVAKVLYEIVDHLFYSYSVELEHLVITKGLFFRARASVPIAKITDVSLTRGPIDLLFVLYDLRIMTSSPVADLTKVDCLSPRRAVGLQNRLLSLIETTAPKVDESAAAAMFPPPVPEPVPDPDKVLNLFPTEDAEGEQTTEDPRAFLQRMRGDRQQKRPPRSSGD